MSSTVYYPKPRTVVIKTEPGEEGKDKGKRRVEERVTTEGGRRRRKEIVSSESESEEEEEEGGGGGPEGPDGGPGGDPPIFRRRRRTSPERREEEIPNSKISGDTLIVTNVFDKVKRKRGDEIQRENFDPRDKEYVRNTSKLRSTFKKEVKHFKEEEVIRDDKLINFIKSVCSRAELKIEDMLDTTSPMGLARPSIIGLIDINPRVKAQIDTAFAKVVLKGKGHFDGMKDFYPFVYTDDHIISTLFCEVTALSFMESSFLSQRRTTLQINGREIQLRTNSAINALIKRCYWDNQNQEIVCISEDIDRSSYSGITYPVTKTGLKKPLYY